TTCVSSFTDPPTTVIYPLSLHDALPIWPSSPKSSPTPVSTTSTGSPGARGFGSTPRRLNPGHRFGDWLDAEGTGGIASVTRHKRSEEHTSELQSPCNLVCRLLLEKKTSIARGCAEMESLLRTAGPRHSAPRRGNHLRFGPRPGLVGVTRLFAQSGSCRPDRTCSHG